MKNSILMKIFSRSLNLHNVKTKKNYVKMSIKKNFLFLGKKKLEPNDLCNAYNQRTQILHENITPMSKHLLEICFFVK